MSEETNIVEAEKTAVPTEEPKTEEPNTEEQAVETPSPVPENPVETPVPAATAESVNSERVKLENEAYQRHFQALQDEIAEIRKKYPDAGAETEPEDPVKRLSGEVNELKTGLGELKELMKNQQAQAANNMQTPVQQQNQGNAGTAYQQPVQPYFQPVFQQPYYTPPMFQTSTIMPAPPLPFIQTPNFAPANTLPPMLSRGFGNGNGMNGMNFNSNGGK